MTITLIAVVILFLVCQTPSAVQLIATMEYNRGPNKPPKYILGELFLATISSSVVCRADHYFCNFDEDSIGAFSNRKKLAKFILKSLNSPKSKLKIFISNCSSE